MVVFLLCYHLYQVFRLNLGDRSKMIIFGSLLTTIERQIFVGSWGSKKIISSLKTNRRNELVQIPDTHNTNKRKNTGAQIRAN